MSLFSPRFTWTWPSWLVELLSGLACCAVALAILTPVWWTATGHLARPSPVVTLAVATLLGIVYELRFDATGWSESDFGQRMIGIVLGTLLWALL